MANNPLSFPDFLIPANVLSVNVYKPLKTSYSEIKVGLNDINRNDLSEIKEPSYFIINLDIFVGKNIDFNANSEDESIVVSVSQKRKDDKTTLNLFYYIDVDIGEFSTPGWVSHEDIVDNVTLFGDLPKMRISPLYTDSKLNIHWFRIFRWPYEDRLICANN